MAKQTRSEKLNRLVKVQRHLEHMAEADLANTTRQRQEVQVSLDATVEAIGSLEPIHQIFAGLYSSQISRLTAKDQHLQNVQQLHESKMMRERAKGDKLAEHMKEARNQEDREAEDVSIYDIIDQQIASKYKPDNL